MFINILVPQSLHSAFNVRTTICRITLLDSAANLGGNIKTFRAPDGSLLEAGPRSLRPSGPQGLATLELIDQLDLTDEVRAYFCASLLD